jgi:hypothetical protein
MRRIIHRSAKAVAFSSSDEDNEDDAFTASFSFVFRACCQIGCIVEGNGV